MRKPRIKEPGAANYHVFSRVIDRRRIFNNDEKDRFVALMRRVEAFCGVKVLTYSVLSNHFHILLHVPKRRKISDGELVRRMRTLYKKQEVRRVERALSRYREAGQHKAAEALKLQYTYRMYDLSEFGKTLLQRFSQSYNDRHERKGTLWEGRFKSILAGKGVHVLSAMAAYIDLNAVRARLVRDPVEYRWCGYAEAVAGLEEAREGIGLVMLSRGQSPDWEEAAGPYRRLLYIRGRARGLTENGSPLNPGFSPEEVQKVLDEGGKLPLDVVLRCRVRYFTEGLVLGSRAYVEDVMRRYPWAMGERHSGEPFKMIGCDWGDLCTVHPVKDDAITVPTH